MASSGTGRCCWYPVVVIAAVCAVLSGIPAFGSAYGVRAQCSPGYYGDATDRGACVLCTGHAVQAPQRGGPVPADGRTQSATSVAVSGSGAVIALGFSAATADGVDFAGLVRVYSWNGEAWVQRGRDIEGVGSGSFGNSVALGDGGNIVSASSPFDSSGATSYSGAVYVFMWGGSSWWPMGTPIVRARTGGYYFGRTVRLSASGTVLVASEFYSSGSGPITRAFVYEWNTGTNRWASRDRPLAGPSATVVSALSFSVVMSSDGNVVGVGSRSSSSERGEGAISVYEWVSATSQYEEVGGPVVGLAGEGLGDYLSVALSGDGLVLAAGVSGRGANGRESGGVRVFRRDGQAWVPMGSVIEGAAPGDAAGSSVGISEDGRILMVTSKGADSDTGSLAVYVWSSGGDWEQRAGVVPGRFAGKLFGTYAALSRDGTVVAGIGGFGTGIGSRVFDLTAEYGVVTDAVCETAYNDDSAEYVAGAGECNGDGSRDVCVACAGGGEYPIGPSRTCGVCPTGEYRHATTYACEACPADSAECQAVFGSSAWSLDSAVTCGGLASGCVGPPSAQCSPGYYGDASDDAGACVRCTGHSVGTVQRGAPVPADDLAAVDAFRSPTSVAVSGSGGVLAVGFSDAAVGGVLLVGAVRVYVWNGLVWEQRGEDINGATAGGGFGTVVALSEDGNIVSGSAPVSRAVSEAAAVIAVFMWDGVSWSARGSPIVGGVGVGYYYGYNFGVGMGMSASGSEVVGSEMFRLNGDVISRAFMYVWDTDTSNWVLRGAPLAGPVVSPVFGMSVAVSGDGDVVVLASRGLYGGFLEGSIVVYEWESDDSQYDRYERLGSPVAGEAGNPLSGYQSVALSGDGMVLAAGLGGRGVNGVLSGGVQVFRRDGAEWVPMGSIIEGAAAGDVAGAGVVLSENGHVLLVPSRGSDSNRGSLAVYVWSSGDWEQRGGVVAGASSGWRFGTYAALSSDGTVVAAGSDPGFGLRVFDLTAEVSDVDDAVCRAAYGDSSAAYVPSLGVCSGEGIRDVCVV